MPQEISITDTIKDLLSDPKNRIKLDEFVTEHVKEFLAATAPANFPLQGSVSQEEFLGRVKRYEELTHGLQYIVALLARWGGEEEILLLEKVFKRLAESERESSGVTLWLRLTWYPIQILMYSAGIAALSARKYPTLKVALRTIVEGSATEGKRLPLVVASGKNMAEISDSFKWLPGQERRYTPRSDHLLDLLKKPLEETLFLGTSYEKLFEEFEIYLALAYLEEDGGDRAPIGRFGWKEEHDRPGSLGFFLEGVKKEGEEWKPLKEGFFKGPVEEFLARVQPFHERVGQLNWW